VGEEELAVALAAEILAAVLSRRYTLNSRRLDRAARRRGIVLGSRTAAAALLRRLAERGFVIDAKGRVWRIRLLRTSKEVRLVAEVVGAVEAAQAVSGG
jgi:xanthine/CO dehydrogenase XdhC/CoxF family maturation factor